MRESAPYPEFVADELKKLVGWGADPKRLAVAPQLRELAGIDHEGSTLAVAGYAIRRWLVEQISTLAGSYGFDGRQVEAKLLKSVLVTLLDLDGRGHCADIRRYDAITRLKMFCSIDKWRRPVGPEFELMLVLARHLTRSPNLDQG